MGDRCTGYLPQKVRKNLCVEIATHRLLTFPKDLLKHGKLDLARMLSSAGIFFSEDFKIIHCFYCSLVIHLKDPHIPLPVSRIHRRCIVRSADASRLPETIAAASMNYEMHRLCSLLKYTKPWKVSPYELAKTGLYKTGRDNEDKTTCFFCEVELCKWDRQDSPSEEHALFVEDHGKQCKLLDDMADDNIPIGKEKEKAPSVSHDGTPTYPGRTKPFIPVGENGEEEQDYGEQAGDSQQSEPGDAQGEPINDQDEPIDDQDEPVDAQQEEPGGQLDEAFEQLLKWASK